MSDDTRRKLEEMERELREQQEAEHRLNGIIMGIVTFVAMMSDGIYMLFASGRINHIF